MNKGNGSRTVASLRSPELGRLEYRSQISNLANSSRTITLSENTGKGVEWNNGEPAPRGAQAARLILSPLGFRTRLCTVACVTSRGWDLAGKRVWTSGCGAGARGTFKHRTGLASCYAPLGGQIPALLAVPAGLSQGAGGPAAQPGERTRRGSGTRPAVPRPGDPAFPAAPGVDRGWEEQ